MFVLLSCADHAGLGMALNAAFHVARALDRDFDLD
jgi:hypothetical protein